MTLDIIILRRKGGRPSVSGVKNIEREMNRNGAFSSAPG